MNREQNSRDSRERKSAVHRLEVDGDPGGSRTPNPQIRSLMLYPVELRGRCKIENRIMVRPERFELPTFWFVATNGCSVQQTRARHLSENKAKDILNHCSVLPQVVPDLRTPHGQVQQGAR